MELRFNEAAGALCLEEILNRIQIIDCRGRATNILKTFDKLTIQARKPLGTADIGEGDEINFEWRISQGTLYIFINDPFSQVLINGEIAFEVSPLKPFSPYTISQSA